MRGIGLACVTLAMLVAAPAAHANLLFEVNSTGDGPDTAVGNHLCDANPQAPGDQCTLRAVIQETNNEPGADGIDFSIPGPGVKAITPKSALPVITGPVEINGYTQGIASPNTNPLGQGDNAVLQVLLSGANGPPTADGLNLDSGAAGSLIRGLVINRFPGAGLVLRAPSTIQGNFIGTSSSGTVARGMGLDGIITGPQDIQIGGVTAAARNLISGNGGNGINGDRDLTIQGNYIGTQRDGASPLANAESGVHFQLIQLGSDSTVGGLGGGNVIAFNGGSGVSISGIGISRGTSISRNRIFSNGGLGIDLDNNGRTPNDPGDDDVGANEAQNFPAIDSAKRAAGGGVTVKGRLQSTLSQQFTLEFFANPPGGNEGKTFLGQMAVATDSTGVAPFSFHPLVSVPLGNTVTGTATNANGSTSEFSAPRTVVAG
jgi:hypothetical protein